MNSAIQPKIQATPAFTESFDWTAAYHLRTAALRRHLIQERILLADGARSLSASDANAMRAPAANDADAAMVALPVRPSFNFAPGDHPLLYRTAGMRNLIAVVSKWIARVVRESFDVWCRCQEVRAYRTLRDLDARMLRDIGVHQSEIGSMAPETSGRAEVTRNWSAWRS